MVKVTPFTNGIDEGIILDKFEDLLPLEAPEISTSVAAVRSFVVAGFSELSPVATFEVIFSAYSFFVSSSSFARALPVLAVCVPAVVFPATTVELLDKPGLDIEAGSVPSLRSLRLFLTMRIRLGGVAESLLLLVEKTGMPDVVWAVDDVPSASCDFEESLVKSLLLGSILADVVLESTPGEDAKGAPDFCTFSTVPAIDCFFLASTLPVGEASSSTTWGLSAKGRCRISSSWSTSTTSPPSRCPRGAPRLVSAL